MHLYTLEYVPSIRIGVMGKLNIVLYMLGGGINNGDLLFCKIRSDG